MPFNKKTTTFASNIYLRMKAITTTFLFVTLAFCSACDDKQHEASTHSVMLIRPEVAGSERVKTYSGIVEEAKEISIGFKVANIMAVK